MEIIFSRYLYALGLLRSCTGYVKELRSAKKDKNTIRSAEILKILMDRVSNAAIRILKMKEQEKYIFVKHRSHTLTCQPVGTLMADVGGMTKKFTAGEVHFGVN